MARKKKQYSPEPAPSEEQVQQGELAQQLPVSESAATASPTPEQSVVQTAEIQESATVSVKETESSPATEPETKETETFEAVVMKVYKRRPDLQRAFPDPHSSFGPFADIFAWAKTFGVKEEPEIAEALTKLEKAK